MEFTEGQIVVIGTRSDRANNPAPQFEGVHVRLKERYREAPWSKNRNYDVYYWEVEYLDLPPSFTPKSNYMPDDVFLTDYNPATIEEIECAIEKLKQIERNLR